MADAYSPGTAIGLGTDNANIAAEIDKTVLRTEADTNFCRAIGCVFLAKAAKIELHACFAEVKSADRERYLVEADEGQYSVNRCLIGHAPG
jgi:hypothetical protein